MKIDLSHLTRYDKRIHVVRNTNCFNRSLEGLFANAEVYKDLNTQFGRNSWPKPVLVQLLGIGSDLHRIVGYYSVLDVVLDHDRDEASHDDEVNCISTVRMSF